MLCIEPGKECSALSPVNCNVGILKVRCSHRSPFVGVSIPITKKPEYDMSVYVQTDEKTCRFTDATRDKLEEMIQKDLRSAEL